LALLAVLLFISSVVPARAARVVAAGPREVVRLALSPATALLTSLSMTVYEPTSVEVDFGDAAQLQEHYGQARQYIEQLERQVAALQEENARLRQVGEVISVGTARPVPAKVTAISNDTLKPVAVIDRGQNQGIRAGLVVVNGYRLVGKVEAAGPFTADVQLITAAGTALRVHLTPATGSSGAHEVQEWIKRADDSESFYADVNLNSPIQVGDLAFLADDLWPAEAMGFVVGVVERIGEDPKNPLAMKRIFVRPLVQPLSRVEVLVPQ
jgi:rod shape-determining protein MreC